jgi:hypothetical protein
MEHPSIKRPFTRHPPPTARPRPEVSINLKINLRRANALMIDTAGPA